MHVSTNEQLRRYKTFCVYTIFFYLHSNERCNLRTNNKSHKSNGMFKVPSLHFTTAASTFELFRKPPRWLRFGGILVLLKCKVFAYRSALTLTPVLQNLRATHFSCWPLTLTFGSWFIVITPATVWRRPCC